MADPTIQTFCCHNANGTDMALTIMKEFNTDAYNGVCMFSSALGIMGSIYQILPRQEYSNNHRWLSASATRGRRIIIWLAVADLFASLGVFTRSSLWINFKNIMPATDDTASVLFCAISSAWTQYFYMATWVWTLCYAIDMRYILSEKESKLAWYHVFAWILPAVLTIAGLLVLYLPDANCHTSKSFTTAVLRILPNYFVTYIPIAVVMIANPLLYCCSTKDMEKIIMCSLGQFTSRERDIMDAIKIKFSVINIVFYICWVPNLINGILLWTLWFHLPISCVITLWYIMALMNPLQALFNCLVYRRWSYSSERVMLPWRKLYSSEAKDGGGQQQQQEQVEDDDSSRSSVVDDEQFPLLQNVPRVGINGYSNYT